MDIKGLPRTKQEWRQSYLILGYGGIKEEQLEEFVEILREMATGKGSKHVCIIPKDAWGSINVSIRFIPIPRDEACIDNGA